MLGAAMLPPMPRSILAHSEQRLRCDGAGFVDNISERTDAGMRLGQWLIGACAQRI